jgi:hypothetical protein
MKSNNVLSLVKIFNCGLKQYIYVYLIIYYQKVNDNIILDDQENRKLIVLFRQNLIDIKLA